ncbi:type IX secretion system membrane protein PorP/SprF [Maribacter polysaccharolyticus]|uniref:PorP/SprF family type IX secretion system membrane protein n=1 Tax=Maribacter polysaccharolyticus TaxID=3020831 RepID=UPI00237F319E|nr:type IX secretion system membrane protein PorP/SprF [Maribacter polysaccharolyticus]MDE3741453.1 type IX secretion system membrane protein PorP/SprF [Maribacter polysaccharolyticus]
MKFRLLLMIAFMAFGFRSMAQEGVPVYFDYLSDNYYLVYPSMAGIGEGGKIRATVRKQWFSVDDAPNLQTLNAHFRLGDGPSGVGAIFFNDANGYHSQTGLKLTYAHHLKLGGDVRYLNQLSFGMSAGLLQSNLDESEFRSVIPDPIITGGKNSVSYFNLDLGMSYSLMEFYAHFAVLNILGSGRDLYTANEFDNLRRYLISGGYVFGRNEWQYEPSILFQLTEFTEEKTMDINFKVYKDVDFGRIWGGLSYRRSFDGAQYLVDGSFGEQRLQLITPIVGANIKNFMVSYNYSYQMGDVRFDNGGFHQITLGYDFGQSERRYDCYCPAAN